MLDNRGEAYDALKQLINEYLGLEGQGAEAQDSSSVLQQNSYTDESSFTFYFFSFCIELKNMAFLWH